MSTDEEPRKRRGTGEWRRPPVVVPVVLPDVEVVFHENRRVCQQPGISPKRKRCRFLRHDDGKGLWCGACGEKLEARMIGGDMLTPPAYSCPVTASLRHMPSVGRHHILALVGAVIRRAGKGGVTARLRSLASELVFVPALRKGRQWKLLTSLPASSGAKTLSAEALAGTGEHDMLPGVAAKGWCFADETEAFEAGERHKGLVLFGSGDI